MYLVLIYKENAYFLLFLLAFELFIDNCLTVQGQIVMLSLKRKKFLEKFFWVWLLIEIPSFHPWCWLQINFHIFFVIICWCKLICKIAFFLRAEAQNCFSIVKSRDINFKVRNLIVTAIGQNQLRKHIKIILSINKSQAYCEQAKRKGEIIEKRIIVVCMHQK